MTIDLMMIHMHAIFLILTTFLAAGVEVVEMVTIVLGVGMTRGWLATLLGSGVGLLVLAVVVGAAGAALQAVPIDLLRALVGILLLLFGVQWLRKGIYRVGLHGFGLGSAEGAGESRPDGSRQGIDWTAFVLAFKGVLLEGLEVVFIVVTFGVATNHVNLAVMGAGAAFVIVVAIAALAHRILQGVPGHVIKFAVGLLLVTYGTFWAADGLGVRWPAGDLEVLFLLGLYGLFSFVCLLFLHRHHHRAVPRSEISH